MEQKATDLIEDTIKSLGFELVKVTVHGSDVKTVEVLIERLDGEKIQISDCQKVSRNISAVLDVEDIIQGKYFLEVSSAGIERPLVKITDFDRFSGKQVKIRLKTPLLGSLTCKGELLTREDQQIKIKSKGIELSVDFHNIKSAKLIMTDEMFRSLLNRKSKTLKSIES